MNEHRGAMFRRVLLVVGANLVGFALCQNIFRRFETAASMALVRLFMGSDRIFDASSTAIGIVPNDGRIFIAIITPSCSALASILALLCLSSTTTRTSRRRRLAATVLSLSVITAGNIARIAGSVAIGVAAGRPSLILFHDWVGGLMTLAYTLGGYVLLLFVLLPRGESGRRRARHAPPTRAPALDKETIPLAH